MALFHVCGFVFLGGHFTVVSAFPGTWTRDCGVLSWGTGGKGLLPIKVVSN